MPTDTVYGLAASLFRPEAVERVFTIKRRQPEAPVPVLLATAADMPLLAREVPRIAWTLIDHFWPGPLTIVLPARPSVPRIVTGGGATVGMRVPRGRTILSLLETVGEPIVGTSANRHGAPPLSNAAAALDALGSEVDAILEDDTLGSGDPSSVVEVGDGEVVLRRAGAIGAEHLRAVVGLRVSLPR